MKRIVFPGIPVLCAVFALFLLMGGGFVSSFLKNVFGPVDNPLGGQPMNFVQGIVSEGFHAETGALEGFGKTSQSTPIPEGYYFRLDGGDTYYVIPQAVYSLLFRGMEPLTVAVGQELNISIPPQDSFPLRLFSTTWTERHVPVLAVSSGQVPYYSLDEALTQIEQAYWDEWSAYAVFLMILFLVLASLGSYLYYRFLVEGSWDFIKESQRRMEAAKNKHLTP